MHARTASTDPFPTPQENLKILKQYSKLLTQACHAKDADLLTAHAQPLSPSPAAYPRNLQWFETLTWPCPALEPAGAARITELLLLHAACDKSVPGLPLLQAYQLAQSLPYFDRDLTAYYLNLPSTAREYDLHVAHSIMRLHSPPAPEALATQLASWPSVTTHAKKTIYSKKSTTGMSSLGLLHVLHVTVLNMPTLTYWFPVDTSDPARDRDAAALAYLLGLPRTPGAGYHEAIARFIATQNPATPTAQAIATTLDRLAILMGVKSNAVEEPDHDLAACLAAFPGFPHLDSLGPQDVWARIKPALIRACPPSHLLVDPVCARKRVRQAKGTW